MKFDGGESTQPSTIGCEVMHTLCIRDAMSRSTSMLRRRVRFSAALSDRSPQRKTTPGYNVYTCISYGLWNRKSVANVLEHVVLCFFTSSSIS